MARLPRDADPRKVIAALGRLGWQLHSTRGSHVHLAHPDKPGIVLTVPFHVGRGVSPGALRSLLRIAGVSVEEFVEQL